MMSPTSATRCDGHHQLRLSRRRVLGGLATMGIASVAGCLGDNEEIDTRPVSLTDGQTCAVCGMEIAGHHGPAVQAFYDDHPVDGDPPVGFDSVHEFVSFDGDQLARGNERLAAYATDYSTVEYEVHQRDEGAYISTHAAADDFVEVDELHYVIESELLGAMGGDAFPFSDSDEAEQVAEEYSGTVVDWQTVSQTFDG